MVIDINVLLSYFENLAFQASTAFDFMQKSSLVFELWPLDK